MDYIELEDSPFDYIRKTPCATCGSPVYLKTGYSKQSIFLYGRRMIAKELQAKLEEG